MRRPAWIGLALALFLSSAPARATIFGSIRGIVHDPQHRPVSGATVKLQSTTSAWSQSASTADDGTFQFSAVPVGEYAITIRHDGFRDAERRIVVDSNSSAILHFELKVVGVTQSVQVSAEEQAAEIDSSSSTTQTLVSRAAIEQTPGAERANSLQMITDYVPGASVVHDQLHIRGGHQVSWLIDGVPVPNTSIASNVGPQFDPKDVDYLEVQRGGYTADYGDRTFGVFNVVPRTGFERNNDAEILATYGSFHQTNSQISFGGHTDRFAYYASVNANRSDYGLETPTEAILHDLGDGVGGFGSLIYNVTPNDQLRLVASLRHDFYQVPNSPVQQAPCQQPLPENPNCAIRDADHEADSFVNFSWVRTLSPGAVLTVSPFYHYNSANYAGGPNDVPVIPVDNRASNYAGLQTSLALVKGKHSVRTGFYVYGQHDHSFIEVTNNPPASVPNSVSQISNPWGNLEAIFVEDQFKATSWLTLNGGVRLTHFGSAISENSADPRIGTAIRIPRLNWTLRGFYGRYYQAPPLDTISGPLLGQAVQQGFAFLPLHGERDEQWEVGLAIPFRGWVLDTDYFHTAARNFLDHDVLGNSNIFFPLTIAHARIRGWETTLHSPTLARRATIHTAYSHQFAQGFGGVTGGLTDFSPPPAGGFYLDHDQRDTLSFGYDVQLPGQFWTSGNVNYGSGFLNGDGFTPPSHLPPHTSFDFSIGKKLGERLSLSFSAVNLTNTRYLLDTSNTFGGTHFNDPREFIGQVRWRFHY
ncbi:MAG TPA: TonB-dependent receptor [Candidatus Limnocylindrales bacterium]|nr:TonB-dependent receptor [Candidatus Limnocylindrales bacterium]